MDFGYWNFQKSTWLIAFWLYEPSQKQKAELNWSHFASFWPANFVKLPRELGEAPPSLLVIIIGARDHWQRTTSWSSSIGARDHRRSSWSLTERKTVKSRWWCHEIGAHFSLLFFGFWCVDLSSCDSCAFFDNFSPDNCCTFCVNSGQDWLRAFATCFVSSARAPEFPWVSSNDRCTWRFFEP